MFKLTGHNSNPLNSYECDASIENRGNIYKVSYKIENYKGHTSLDFSKDYKLNEGLWDFDVCEAFLTHEHEHYLEIQSSPLNQTFSYYIESPREKFYLPENLNLKVSNSVNRNSWNCEMIISKKDIPGKGQLKGNLFVVLKEKDQRCYFALNINPEKSADFHKPDLFKKLL